MAAVGEQSTTHGSNSSNCSSLEADVVFPSCEWTKSTLDGGTVECGLQFQYIDAFLTHTREHFLTDCSRDARSEGETQFTCLWKYCGWQTTRRIEFTLHVLYHPYHTYLKHLGSRHIQKTKLPRCELGQESCNIIPEFDGLLECQWDGCTEQFDCAWEFYRHTEDHVRDSDPLNTGANKTYRCLWTDCSFSGKSIAKLLEHTNVHTQRKAIACPTCGGLFASNAKLGDHLNRQKTDQGRKYVCQLCSKSFNTDRLLKTHMSCHVNKYKCPHCDMSCPNLSAMDYHIQWRHSTVKSFICQICKKAFKTESVLKRHMETHSGINIDCPFPGCGFLTNSAYHYKAHLDKHHLQQSNDKEVYCCHECDKKYSSGSELSEHLREEHHYAPLPGHNRFRFIRCPDGTRRLQTVRIEKQSLVEIPKP